MSNYSFKLHVDDVKLALERQCDTALATIGMVAEGYAARLCPVDTGRLRASITHQVDRQEKTAYIGTNVGYGIFLELGTGKYYPGGRQTRWAYKDTKGDVHWTNGMKAQPFIKPAIADHIDEYEDIIKRILGD